MGYRRGRRLSCYRPQQQLRLLLPKGKRINKKSQMGACSGPSDQKPAFQGEKKSQNMLGSIFSVFPGDWQMLISLAPISEVPGDCGGAAIWFSQTNSGPVIPLHKNRIKSKAERPLHSGTLQVLLRGNKQALDSALISPTSGRAKLQRHSA